jgi:hypothetical protein
VAVVRGLEATWCTRGAKRTLGTTWTCRGARRTNYLLLYRFGVTIDGVIYKKDLMLFRNIMALGGEGRNNPRGGTKVNIVTEVHGGGLERPIAMEMTRESQAENWHGGTRVTMVRRRSPRKAPSMIRAAISVAMLIFLAVLMWMTKFVRDGVTTAYNVMERLGEARLPIYVYGIALVPGAVKWRSRLNIGVMPTEAGLGAPEMANRHIGMLVRRPGVTAQDVPLDSAPPVSPRRGPSC